jgi:leucyl-tRNA synthetase
MKWTQWIFLQLFKNGLAQQSEKLVNWCPALGTVLANEEIINGLSERGSHPVVKLPLRQWLLKITEYADKLEAGLADIDWPEGTLSAQKQWIGKSNGVTLKFNIIGDNVPTGTKVEVFTTRIETLHGVTYLVLAPEHNLVPAITSKEQYNIVEAYKRLTINENDVDRVSSSKSKAITGVFLGTYAVHPLTGESLPIWIADYVLGSYGTGAVMAVPAHDTRDYEFAQNFKLPIRRVVSSSTEMNDTLPYTGPGIVCNSSPELNGLSSTESAARLTSELVSKGLGKASVMYKLRDWVFSRQRYWGEPIPIYFPVDVIGEDHSHFDPHNSSTYTIRYDCPIAVPEEELPLKLPDMVDFSPGDNPEGCLARCVEWRFFKKDGKLYARETNTMPQVRIAKINM